MNNFELNHCVYDRTLELLAARQAEWADDGSTLTSPLLPGTKRYLLLDGHTQLENAQAESQLLDTADCMRNLVVKQLVPSALHFELSPYGQQDQIMDNRIVPVPNHKQNLATCEKLMALFSELQLLSVPGFGRGRVLYDGTRTHTLYLNLSSALAEDGFIVPVRQKGRISGLRIFRNPHDEHPFILKSKGGARHDKSST